VEGFQLMPWAGNAIITEMEGGNTRTRRRPGDSVAAISQRVRFTAAELATFKTWFGTTLSGGAARFTMQVWTGCAFENKVCQFDLKSPPQYIYLTPEMIDISMALRVYGV
jgi:hypothetical protein